MGHVFHNLRCMTTNRDNVVNYRFCIFFSENMSCSSDMSTFYIVGAFSVLGAILSTWGLTLFAVGRRRRQRYRQAQELVMPQDLFNMMPILSMPQIDYAGDVSSVSGQSIHSILTTECRE